MSGPQVFTFSHFRCLRQKYQQSMLDLLCVKILSISSSDCFLGSIGITALFSFSAFAAMILTSFSSIFTSSEIATNAPCRSGENLSNYSFSLRIGSTPGSVVIHLICDQIIMKQWYWNIQKCQ